MEQQRHNPLLDPRPDDPIEQIHAYARDLAYLTLYGDYPSVMMDLPTNEIFLSKQEISNHFNRKWGGFVHEKYLTEEQIKTALGHRTESADKEGHIVEIRKVNPSLALLESWDNLQVRPPTKERQQHTYKLTTKAFQLLEKPSRPPSIFISYRREESSAFALLIESRLLNVGALNVYLDKNIRAGEDWEQHLEHTIRQCKILIVLISTKSLNQTGMIEKEVAWAVETGCDIISIWHNKHRMQNEKNYPSILAKKQFIVVEDESAKHYETAINELLNTLGYRTY
jgi:hypothetical protein